LEVPTDKAEGTIPVMLQPEVVQVLHALHPYGKPLLTPSSR
jgi:hypothetical protein